MSQKSIKYILLGGILFLISATIYTFSFSKILKFRHDFYYISNQIEKGHIFIGFTYSFTKYANVLVYETMVISGKITLIFIFAILLIFFWKNIKNVYNSQQFSAIKQTISRLNINLMLIAIIVLIVFIVAILFTLIFAAILNFRYNFNDVSDALLNDDIFISIRYAYLTYENPLVMEAIQISLAVAIIIPIVGYGALYFTKPKNLHGNAKFASFSDLLKAKLFANRGLYLGKFGNKHIINNEPHHTILFGPTRSGKGVSHVIPNILSWEGSIICIDPKFENYDICANERIRKGNKVFNFAPGKKKITLL